MTATKAPKQGTIKLEKWEVGLLQHAIHVLHRDYLKSEIDQKGDKLFECHECGNTGPSPTGITHHGWCWFQNYYALRAKLQALSSRL